jgi:hypothetical protein
VSKTWKNASDTYWRERLTEIEEDRNKKKTEIKTDRKTDRQGEAMI